MLSLIALLPGSAAAKIYSPVNAGIYYEIGGADLVNMPPGSSLMGPNLSVGTEFKLPSVCEIWDSKMWKDPDVVGKMVEDYAKGYIKNLGTAVVGYLAGAAQTLAVAALQRALPGMYDYSQNLFSQMQLDIDFATKSCQQAVDEMDAGLNPFDGWITTSKSMKWRSSLSDQYTGTETNILDVEESMRQNPNETSINWFGGPKGGAAADPIKLVKDVTSAGYAAALGLDYQGTPVTAATTHSETQIGAGGTQSNVDDHMKELFATSDQAATFANQVVGEQTISYCETCTGSTTPGVGLKPTYLGEKETLVKAWNALLTKYPTAATYPKIADFNGVSSSKVRITKRVYSALMSMDTEQDKKLLINRLVSDVAVDRTVEKALVLRQFLKSGYATPQVQAIPEAQKDVQTYIDHVKHEIDDFQWEVDTQDKMAAKTSAAILRMDAIDKLRYTGSRAPVYQNKSPKLQDDRLID
jgi:integrating conjugative element protein (TIGR03755 family)